MDLYNIYLKRFEVMTEKEVKIKVIEWLHKNEKHGVIIPEVTFGNTTKMNTIKAVRADIFALNGDISIYEIKTEKDNLDRLPYQLELYTQYANRVSVVVADKFLEHTKKLSEEIGIYIIADKNIQKIRSPKSHRISIDKYLNYWWGIELKKLFRGVQGKSALHLTAALEELQEMLSEDEIKRLTIFRLKERYQKENDLIVSAIKEKAYDKLFPKKVFNKSDIQVTPLKDIPFGILKGLA